MAEKVFSKKLENIQLENVSFDQCPDENKLTTRPDLRTLSLCQLDIDNALAGHLDGRDRTDAVIQET